MNEPQEAPKPPSFEEQNEKFLKDFALLLLTERHKLRELRALNGHLSDISLALSNISTALAILLPPLKSVDPSEQARVRAQGDRIRAGWNGY